MGTCRSLSPGPGCLLTLVLLLAACQAPASAPAPSKPPAATAPTVPAAPSAPTALPAESGRLPERTRLVNGANIGVAFPAYIALERGYFADVNLELDLQDFLNSADIMAHLATGQIDAGQAAATPGVFNAIGRGLVIKAILDLNHLDPSGRSHVLLARQELYDAGQLRGVDQLKGRRVALNTVPGGLVIDLDRALQRVGLGLDDVELVQIPFPEQPVALGNGSIDAGVMFEPLASLASERKLATPIRYLNEDYPNHHPAFTMIGARLVERPELARAYAVAYVRGARDYERARQFGENVEEVAAIIAKYNRQDPAVVAALLRSGRMTINDPNGRIDLSSVQYDIEWYRDRGYLDRDLSANDFVDLQYADYATRLLGPFR